jgi:hypothetical protein
MLTCGTEYKEITYIACQRHEGEVSSAFAQFPRSFGNTCQFGLLQRDPNATESPHTLHPYAAFLRMVFTQASRATEPPIIKLKTSRTLGRRGEFVQTTSLRTINSRRQYISKCESHWNTITWTKLCANYDIFINRMHGTHIIRRRCGYVKLIVVVL